MTNVIRAENLTRRFGEFIAVDHLNLEVQAGQVLGFLGPNGSGKTTTIRMLLGLLHPSEGRAEVLGYDVVAQSDQVRAHTGYMSQKFALYNELTARENLSFYAGVYGVRDRRRVGEVLQSLGLTPFQHERVQNLSTGWRQRLALAAAIVHRPGLLFLDEPTSGVDPVAALRLQQQIAHLQGPEGGHPDVGLCGRLERGLGIGRGFVREEPGGAHRRIDDQPAHRRRGARGRRRRAATRAIRRPTVASTTS